MKQKRSRGTRKASDTIAGQRIIRVFTDGSGARVDGEGSGFAWLREDTDESDVELVRGLTNNQAECHAVFAALKSAERGGRFEVLSDSQLVVGLLSGVFETRNAELANLVGMIGTVIERNKLSVQFTWVPRAQNRADTLLQRAKSAPRTLSAKQGV
jgi:ribonuclease HI